VRLSETWSLLALTVLGVRGRLKDALNSSLGDCQIVGVLDVSGTHVALLRGVLDLADVPLGQFFCLPDCLRVP
jgi:hypothetical protein